LNLKYNYKISKATYWTLSKAGGLAQSSENIR